jgi:hypothetical protein
MSSAEDLMAAVALKRQEVLLSAAAGTAVLTKVSEFHSSVIIIN